MPLPKEDKDKLSLPRESVRASVVAALMRVNRRIGEGFEGEITISVRRGGVAFIRWTQTETGTAIKDELE